MDNKLFFHYIKELNKILKQPKTFTNKRRARKIRKDINKLIKSVAKIQARVVYNQTINVYQDILNSNLD